MSDKIELKAEARQVIGTGVRALRRSGKVPAVIYGAHVTPSHVQLDLRETTYALRKAGRNSLISLVVDGAQQKMVLMREVQRDPIKRILKHIDFLEVSMTEKLTSRVSLRFVGESADIKSGVGVLIREMDEVRIRSLPQDLVEEITVDVSGLAIDQSIHLNQITVPPGIEILDDMASEIVRVSRFVEAKVEELAAPVAEVEVIEKGKKEEEGAEGAPAAPAGGAAAAKKK